MRRAYLRISLAASIVTLSCACVSFDLFSADRAALDGRTMTERLLIRLKADLDIYAEPPWTDAARPEREGLSGFLATISRTFRGDGEAGDPRSARLRTYADTLASAPDPRGELASILAADLERLADIAERVDGLRRTMSAGWTIAALTEALRSTERAIALAVRRRDGFSALCRRLTLADDGVCLDAMADYGRRISLLRADAEAAAELLQRKSASISS